MRGVARHAVTCMTCGRQNGSPKDRTCPGCRLRARPNPHQRFHWTEELDARLRDAYRRAGTRSELTRNLTNLQYISQFTRVVITARATALGLTLVRRRPWNETEIEALRERLGVCTTAQIARDLGRSFWSIKAQISRMNMSARLTEGYSQTDLVALLGVSPKTVKRWIEIGWLPMARGRITESTVVRFLRRHPEEYRLGRVNEAWFKGLLFPAFGSSHTAGLAAKPAENIGDAHFTVMARPTPADQFRNSDGEYLS